MTTWGDVMVDDIIVGSNNSYWTVLSIDEGVARVQNSLTMRVVESVINPSKDVVIAVRAQDVEDAAVALTTVQVGGEVLSRKNEVERYMCPLAYTHPGAWISHMMVFHGRVPSETLTDSGLVAYHHKLHEQQGSMHADHVHDPDFYRDKRE